MILEEIVAHKRAEVADRVARRPPDQVTKEADAAPPVRDFRAALSGPDLAFIAEIKAASPSSGVIRHEVDPVAFARTYERGGADALSVLVDSRYFYGSLEHLSAVTRATALPVLCKEFIIDTYQIEEAKAAGASAVLLIAALLDQVHLKAFLTHARRRGLAALVEVHTPAEVSIALEAGADIVGINNRNLTTLTVDPTTTARLRPLIPAGIVVVSESGFASKEQIDGIKYLGVDAVLIGTSLMASADPEAKLRELRGVSHAPR
jgi:indole-3-glycerol phosphate synthase